MAELTIECPSGLQGRIRGLKGKDFRELDAARTPDKANVAIAQILRNCWLETLEPGPYASGDIRWEECLIGDRFYTLVQIRRATYPGEAYDFETTCTNPACRKKMPASLELEDLEIKKLPDESREVFASGGNRFETTVSDGRKVWFKLMTGSDIKKQKQIQDLIGPSARGIVLTLCSRILEVEGLKSKNARDVFAFLDDLEFSEHRDLLDAFDKADCGVQTDINIECQWCGQVVEMQLPLGRRFFLPSKEKQSLLTSGAV